jgi:acetyl esterase/lipase
MLAPAATDWDFWLMNFPRPPFALIIISLGFLPGLIFGADSGTTPYEQKVDVVFGEVSGTGLLMDVFTPKRAANGLGIVDVVSGAYRSDRNKIRDHTLAQVYTILCGRGYTVFAMRPGSSPRYMVAEMAAHVNTGIRYVKQHAADYKIDPERLGLTGASAGGHIAGLVAVVPEEGKPDASGPLRYSTSVKAAALFFPPTDLLDWDGKTADYKLLRELLFPADGKDPSEEEVKARATSISPARLVNHPSLPFLFIHGDADPIVPLQQSKKMVEAIKSAGGSAELIIKKGGGHPWFTIPEEVKVMADWFDRQLGAIKADSTAGAAK